MFWAKFRKILLGLSFFFVLGANGGSTLAEDNRHMTNPKLRPYMAKFGTMFAGIELMAAQEQKVDWDVVNQSIATMSQALSDLKTSDTEGRFNDYTSELSVIMQELQTLAAKKSKKFFPTLDKLDQACFKCHAANRPSDFPVLKKDHVSQLK